MRILAIRGGALGDFLVTLPAIGLLRARWPEARLELLGHPRPAAVALGRHYLDAVRALDGADLAPMFAPEAEIAPALAEWFRSFDLIVSWLGGGAFQENLGPLLGPRASRPPRDAGSLSPAAGPLLISGDADVRAAPAAACFCRPLATLGLETSDFRSRLCPTEDDRRAGAVLLAGTSSPRIAIHPGSGSPRKNWPLERWAEVADALAAGRGASIVWVMGEVEVEAGLVDRLPERLRRPPHVLLIERPLTALAGALGMCELFLGHDSGVSHLAAAAGAECRLLFGPTDPAVWAPPGPGVQVLRAPGGSLEELGVRPVAAWAGAARPGS